MSQFLITALWSTTDFDDNNLDDNFSVDDISEEFQVKAQAICDTFLAKAIALNLFTEEELNDEDDTIDHDLWLTIHHHGAGFWDGDYEHRDALTKLAETFPEIEDELRNDLGV
jgi:hypothetical protein